MLMELDVAIPAHNEEAVILSTIEMVSDALDAIPGLTWRIIVAENGSSDNTYDVVSNAKLRNVEVFRAKACGKGAAIKEAAERSNATYFGFTDADCSPHPKTFAYALEVLKDHDADLVIGSRFHPDSTSDRSMLRNTSSRIFNLFARTLVGVHSFDTQCPMKVMTTSAKKHLLRVREDKWLVDLEHIARVERDGLVIATVPVEWTEFRYAERRSKLSLPRDGGNAILGMLRMRKLLNTEKSYGA